VSTIRTSVLTYGALQMQTTYLLTYLQCGPRQKKPAVCDQSSVKSVEIDSSVDAR